jgi:hypothetical protein
VHILLRTERSCERIWVILIFNPGYGRSFTLKDPSCNIPNGICEFTGGANPGPCSDASGILDYQEIQDIISQNSLTPIHDEAAAVKCEFLRIPLR